MASLNIPLESQLKLENGEDKGSLQGPDASTIIISSSSPSNQPVTVLRLDVPVPFFMKNDVFKKFGEPDYGWQRSKEMMVVLVRKPSDENTAAPTPNKETEEDDVKYSIGGRPLECPFDLNEDFEEALVIDSIPTVFSCMKIPPNYYPLGTHEGSWAIRKVMVQIQPFVQELSLVKGTAGWPDRDTPVFSFVDYSDKDQSLSLTGIRRDAQGFNVNAMGRFRPDAEIMDMNKFKWYHGMNVITLDNRSITSIAHSVYEKHPAEGEYPSRGKVYMEFMFKEPTKIFGPPPDDSESKIAVRPMAGDANPSMRSLWSEIEDLEKWIHLLELFSEPDAGSGGADVTSFLSSTAYEMTDNTRLSEIGSRAVKDLLTKERVVDFFGYSSTEISDSLDALLQRIVLQERTDCDFTDRIWSVVRKCENLEELQESLQLVFQAVAKKMYRPYLLLTNTSVMAKDLTRAMKGEMTMTNLLEMTQGKAMVEMMIECGVQKLFKDYNFALERSQLIERGEIDHLIPSISEISASLSKLKQLHCILEIMCLSKERLKLSVKIQAGHVKKLLRRFSEPTCPPFTWDQTYHFDVLPSDIYRSMTGLHPFYFKVKMDSKTDLKWATTTVAVSTEQYINYKKTASDDTQSLPYYVYLICESGRIEK